MDCQKTNSVINSFSLKTLLKWKVKMNREKDKKDIELIKNIII